MKATDNTETAEKTTIVSKKTKVKLSKKNARVLLIIIIVLIVLAALLYLKPAEDESNSQTQYYSDLETSVPVFDAKADDKNEDSNTTSITPNLESTSDTSPDVTKQSETGNDTAIGDKGQPVDQSPLESHTDGITEVNPSETTEQTSPIEAKTDNSQTPSNTSEMGSTDLPPAPAPAPEVISDKPDTVGSVDLDKDVVSYQNKMLEDLYKHKVPNAPNTTETDQFEKMEYTGNKQNIAYVEGEQTKIYMYKNFAVKIFLGAQPNKKQLETLDYFINGSDNNTAFTVRLLKNNTILLSKNEAEQTWGGTDLFVTAGDRTYTFIILQAQTPSERTDSIRYIAPNSTNKK